MATYRFIRFVGGCFALVAGSGCVADPVNQAGAGLGGEIAASLCARCHDVSDQGPSPVAAAPPFPVLVNRWPPAFLAEALAEGITVGHRGAVQMPEFQLEPEQIDALIAYLEQLKVADN